MSRWWWRTRCRPGIGRARSGCPRYDATRRDAALATVRAVGRRARPGRWRATASCSATSTWSTGAGLPGLSRAASSTPSARSASDRPTWRPPQLEWLPFGLLRIDMVFTANGVAPSRIAHRLHAPRQRPLHPAARLELPGRRLVSMPITSVA